MGSTNKTIAEQAAAWILALDDGDKEQQVRTHQEFLRWQEADPRHAQAADTMQQFIGKFTGLRSSPIPARHALDEALSVDTRQQSSKHRSLAATLLGLVLVIPLIFLLGFLSLNHPTADLHSGAGEWQRQTLPDGSRITLAGKTAVEILFDENRRELHLHSGEILVDVAKDPGRPFVVTTTFGQIEALGTRFIVNHHPNHTRLAMLESRARIYSSNDNSSNTKSSNAIQTSKQNASVVVIAGEQISLDENGLGTIEKMNAAMREQSWHKQQLVVRGWPLVDVLRELARYHPAYFYVDEKTLPAISVSAVLPLDKPDAALQLLSTSFPSIRVENLTPWARVIGGMPQEVADPHN